MVLKKVSAFYGNQNKYSPNLLNRCIKHVFPLLYLKKSFYLTWPKGPSERLPSSVVHHVSGVNYLKNLLEIKKWGWDPKPEPKFLSVSTVIFRMESFRFPREVFCIIDGRTINHCCLTFIFKFRSLCVSHFIYDLWGSRDRMVVGCTTTCTIRAYHH